MPVQLHDTFRTAVLQRIKDGTAFNKGGQSS